MQWWLTKPVNDVHKVLLQRLPICMCWGILKCRYKARFENVLMSGSKGYPEVAGGGGIVRYHDSQTLVAFALSMGFAVITWQKLTLQGLSMCIDKGYLKTIVESDSMLLEGNGIAGQMANLGVTGKEQVVFTEDLSLPRQARASLKQEQDGIPNFRFKIKKNVFTSD
ncbi:hypothetical protein HAX54_001915 [Datura stramonium]|uniref:RNase H type-1 domain-containing protein n=1 Tax=Datura stramonium TaxID=4076 RepID=A0ABS8RTB8_DATST|nr:hypothetical protein [Datura stramonium]